MYRNESLFSCCYFWVKKAQRKNLLLHNVWFFKGVCFTSISQPNIATGSFQIQCFLHICLIIGSLYLRFWGSWVWILDYNYRLFGCWVKAVLLLKSCPINLRNWTLAGPTGTSPVLELYYPSTINSENTEPLQTSAGEVATQIPFAVVFTLDTLVLPTGISARRRYLHKLVFTCVRRLRVHWKEWAKNDIKNALTYGPLCTWHLFLRR